MPRPFFILFLLLSLLAPSRLFSRQHPAPAPAILLHAQKFTFTALSLTPLHGQSRTLDRGYYTVAVTPDSLICYLPYLGAQYTFPTSDDLSNGGYKFLSTAFTYHYSAVKRGWNIEIATRQEHSELKFFFSISKSGWADLSITSSDRDPISYYGQITKP